MVGGVSPQARDALLLAEDEADPAGQQSSLGALSGIRNHQPEILGKADYTGGILPSSLE
jgi:hypothetical protein